MIIYLIELLWYLEGIFVKLCLLYLEKHVNKWWQHFFVEEICEETSSFFYFRYNMHLGHSETNNYYAQWLLEISAGTTIDDSNIIQVPQLMFCADLNTLINRVYLRISHQGVKDNQYFLDCIILCSKNNKVYNINEAILQQFNPGPNIEVHILRSVDSILEKDRMHHAYPAEFLQQLNTGRLPPALFCLKVGCPVILLRNLDPREGLCNGTRIVVLNIRRKVLQYRIINKDKKFAGEIILIPRIRLSSNTKTLSVPLRRLQFLVRLVFAMTINKSQEQLVEHIGINLKVSVFLHKQLYVAFSRCISLLNISVLLLEQSQKSKRTLNIVYKEVFNSIRPQ